jgi:WD40 repeat protein
MTAAWEPTGRRLVVGNESGFLIYIEGQPTRTHVVSYEPRVPIDHFQCVPPARLMVVVAQGHNEAVKAMRWTHAGDYMLTGAKDGMLKYWTHTYTPANEFR